MKSLKFIDSCEEKWLTKVSTAGPNQLIHHFHMEIRHVNLNKIIDLML